MFTLRKIRSNRNLLSRLLGLVRLFSIYSQLTFPILVIGLALLSLGAWWSVKTVVDGDIRSRLDSEADRVESAFRDRISTFANSLIHIRGTFIVSGIPTREEYRKFVGTLEVPERFPGSRGIGYAPVTHPQLTAKVALLEPKDWQNEKAIGFDILSEEIRRSAVYAAAQSGEPTMTGALRIPAFSDRAQGETGFLILLPLYNDSPHRNIDNVVGLIYAAFTAKEFFEGTFGVPSLKKENVNFILEKAGAESGAGVLYNRFGINTAPNLNDSMKIEKPMRIFDQNFRLVMTPLPHFYTWSDQYLPAAVGFGAAFISILILLVLRATQTQLIYETRAREASVEAAEKSREQTERLKKLNDHVRHISSELDLTRLVGKVLELATDLAGSHCSFFYFTSGQGQDVTLSLQGTVGFEESAFTRKAVLLSESSSLLPNRLMVSAKDEDGASYLANFLKEPVHFGDWRLFEIPSREFGRCGLVFVSRAVPAKFDEVEIEILEAFIAQTASAIENARLYRRAEDASRAKNAFLANMSHEIRTPLNAIIGFSEILLKEGMPEKQKHHLSRSIRKGSQQLTRIIDDILDLSRIEAGKFLIEQKKIRLATLLKEVKTVMDLRASEKRVHLSLETSGLLPEYIVTDEVRLKQILMNILGNAIKFTEKGSVGLLVKHLDHGDGSQLAFKIKDTGIGIPEEAQGRIFEPFSQGDESKTRRFGGSGLGLGLAKRLAQELGGDVMLKESMLGSGSTFEARVSTGQIPGVDWRENIFETPSDEQQARVSPPGRLSGVKLLLVEDSLDNQEIFRFFLEQAGALVEVADNGLEAVTRAKEGSFDMILMDIQIPEIDGKEATRRIRNLGYTSPIVALTAHAMIEERRSCIEAGCNGQITKPVSGDNLISEISEYLRKAAANGTSNRTSSTAQHLAGDETAIS